MVLILSYKQNLLNDAETKYRQINKKTRLPIILSTLNVLKIKKIEQNMSYKPYKQSAINPK